MKRRNFLFASLLSVPLGIFAKSVKTARPKKGIKVSADESRFDGMLKQPDKSAALCKVSAADTNGDLLFIGPGEKSFTALGGPPLHVHHYQDEIFFVAAGAYQVQVGDETFTLKEGDTVFAPREVPHTFTRLGEMPGKLVTIFQPAGKMESFFSKLNSLTGMPSRDEFVKLFEEHDMKIVGPPILAK